MVVVDYVVYCDFDVGVALVVGERVVLFLYGVSVMLDDGYYFLYLC